MLWWRKFWFKRKLRSQRRWHDFLNSIQPQAPVAVPNTPDMNAAAVQGMASLITALSSAEIDRIKATETDRQREFEARQKAREAARVARSESAKRRWDPATKKLRGFDRPASECKVCAGRIDITPTDVNEHYAAHHPNPQVQ